jgi:hypothetical protein
MSDLALVSTIEKLALANLAKRAQSGESLSGDDWRRLEQLKTAATASGPDLSAIADRMEASRKRGKAPPKALIAELRTASAGGAAACWPDVKAATAELATHHGGQLSLQTVRNWLGEAGLSTTAIPRADLYRWLYLRERTRQAAPADNPELAQRLELQRVRIAERSRSVVVEAIDRAQTALLRMVADLRPRLTAELPSEAAESIVVRELRDRMDIESEIRSAALRILDSAVDSIRSASADARRREQSAES